MKTKLFTIIMLFCVCNICSAVSCTFGTGGIDDILFSNYDTTDPVPHDTNGTVHVSCMATGSETRVWGAITISGGSSGDYTNRTMLSGINSINYEIHRTSVAGPLWGNTFGSWQWIWPPQSLPFANNYIMYGRIPVLQSVPAGLYTDTLNATLYFFNAYGPVSSAARKGFIHSQ